MDAGDVGYSIADKLSKESFEVTVLDESQERLKKYQIILMLKLSLGVPSLPSTLSNAGAKDCDILIAVTKSDETNMICCQIGHSLFEIFQKKLQELDSKIILKGEWQNLYTKKLAY